MTVRIIKGASALEFRTEENEQIKASDFLKKKGVFFSMPCGGHGKCLNCRINIKGDISGVTPEEKHALSEEEIERGTRLACFTYIKGDCVITLPEEKENIMTDFGSDAISGDGNEGGNSFGIAADIGTTTVCAYLYDLSNGKQLAKRASKNAQVLYGSDVISRIESSLAGHGNDLKKLISDQLDGMIAEMCAETGVDFRKISKAVLTGNTAMLYLLTGRDIDCLSHAPFEADTLFGGNFRKKVEITSLSACKYICLPPCIGSYVGADITCAVESTGTHKRKDTVLLADIGTNGEIVLMSDGKMSCCSTAAGPAFEGSGLSCGVTAKNGAISHVRFEEGKITYETVGGAPAIGFCGSGIVDAVAVMLKTGIIDETGRINDEFIIDKNGEDCAEMCGFLISQKDVRSIQMGKAAICAGILTLIDKAGIQAEDVDEVLIAGGFGSFIDVCSAGCIGLIPHALAEKAHSVGNAAAKGAVDILLDERSEEICSDIGSATEVIDLTTDPGFSDRYIECMMFE